MAIKSTFLAIVYFIICVWQDTDIRQKQQEAFKKEKLRFLFYNVENLFDTQDDPFANDEEFLPDAGRYWTPARYQAKLNNLYKVIVAAGEWYPPTFIGLCEVENKKVLIDLTQNTPLTKFEYSIIHHDSPDKRGIDVALLYLEKYFRVLDEEPVRIALEYNDQAKTRDILYVKGIVLNKDTLHIFINHWPSRRGGQQQSEKFRMEVASVLRHKSDSIIKTHPAAKIIITGDFNDEPLDKSLVEGLETESPGDEITSGQLYNLSLTPTEKKSGTLKYQGAWYLFDQFIVSGAILADHHGLHTSQEDYHIVASDFLLQPDEKFSGNRTLPTYSGFNYIGGFSDHLPVYLDLYE